MGQVYSTYQYHWPGEFKYPEFILERAVNSRKVMLTSHKYAAACTQFVFLLIGWLSSAMAIPRTQFDRRRTTQYYYHHGLAPPSTGEHQCRASPSNTVDAFMRRDIVFTRHKDNIR
eukprot:6186766-Pleurochrysis_carterae.AAC.1